MRLLYLYPEEWTGRRAREVHTLSTCVALAEIGHEVTLVTGGGQTALEKQRREIGATDVGARLSVVTLSRSLGPVRSATIFARRFDRWRHDRPAFDEAFCIHLKAAEMLGARGLAYAFEAHEIFAETPARDAAQQRSLENLERTALVGARRRVATSHALATALTKRYDLPDNFNIVPNAGGPPLAESVAEPGGPLVYAGSLADWKGLDLVLAAAREARVSLRIVGGTEAEWGRLAATGATRDATWQPRVGLGELPAALRGARAGLIPTLPETGSGRYSCPMKLFDYARCGLPVLTTALPSLQSLDTGSWCTPLREPTVAAWTEAFRDFSLRAESAGAALRWAGEHTWSQRARRLYPAPSS